MPQQTRPDRSLTAYVVIYHVLSVNIHASERLSHTGRIADDVPMQPETLVYQALERLRCILSNMACPRIYHSKPAFARLQ